MNLEKMLMVTRLYRELRSKMDKFEGDMLKLLAHPESTNEQINECRAAYQHLLYEFDRVDAAMRKNNLKTGGHHGNR